MPAAGHVWELDVFAGDNEGLVAEVELSSADETVDLPAWAGAEVSDDDRYYNVNLAARPYRTWGSHPADSPAPIEGFPSLRIQAYSVRVNLINGAVVVGLLMSIGTVPATAIAPTSCRPFHQASEFSVLVGRAAQLGIGRRCLHGIQITRQRAAQS